MTIDQSVVDLAIPPADSHGGGWVTRGHPTSVNTIPYDYIVLDRVQPLPYWLQFATTQATNKFPPFQCCAALPEQYVVYSHDAGSSGGEKLTTDTPTVHNEQRRKASGNMESADWRTG